MPNRIIKESICTSEEIDILTPEQEVFFYRLMVVVDDFGLMDARLSILKAKCYPLKSIEINCIQLNMARLQEVGLVKLYQADGKPYLSIVNWAKHQQIRAKRAKYPTPESGSEINCNQLQSNAPVIQSNPNPIQSNHKLLPSTAIAVSGATTESTEVEQSTPIKPKQPRLITPEGETPLQMACRETWHAYSLAYSKRYGADPVRNATVSSQIKQFVQRIGVDESPQVAAFFVAHNAQFYVKKMHSVGVLLTDAEKIRTEWATGRKMTNLEAKNAEQVDAVQAQVERVGRMLGVS